ncbi:hypothetical protein LEMLEM_LOCUS13661, partial [Lemmus lemmus]
SCLYRDFCYVLANYWLRFLSQHYKHHDWLARAWQLCMPDQVESGLGPCRASVPFCNGDC